MEDKAAFYKKLLRLALPLAFQSLMLAAVAACDALMLGRIAQEEMAAVSLATQVQFIQNMILTALAGAGTILGAQYWGKGDRRTVRLLFNGLLWLGGVISLLFFSACELVPDVLMRLLTNEGTLAAIGVVYLRTAGWSYLLAGLSQCCLAVMKVTEHVKPAAFISSFAVAVNIVLNAVLIFGLLGLPAMNSKGAALATTISRAAELLLCVILLCRKDYVSPDWGRFFAVPKLLVKDLFRHFLPLTGGYLLWSVGFASYTAVMGHMGADAAAANSAVAVVRDLVCCMCNGLAGAAAIMVGNEMGAGRLEDGKICGTRIRNVSFLAGLLSSLLVLASLPVLSKMIVLTDTARQYLTGMMLIQTVYIFGRCFNTIVVNGVLDAGGDTLFDMYSLAVCMWMVAVPASFVSAFVFHWPVLVVYSACCLDELIQIPWCLARFKKYKWVRDLTRDELGD